MKIMLIICAFYLVVHLLRKVVPGADTDFFREREYFSKTLKRIEVGIIATFAILLLVLSSRFHVPNSYVFFFLLLLIPYSVIRGIDHWQNNRKGKEYIFYWIWTGFSIVMGTLIGIGLL